MQEIWFIEEAVTQACHACAAGVCYSEGALGRSRVTIKDIAERVNVSPRAVSAALNGTGRVSVATRERIRRTAREMNYQPNMLARGLVSRRTFLIGVVLPYVSNSFFSRILHGIEERCVAEDFDLLLGNSEGISNEHEDGALERMINRNVDGVICSPNPTAYRTYARLREHGVPVLQLMRAAEGLRAPYVGVDDLAGGLAAVRYLISIGHRRIGFLGHRDERYAAIRDRREGYFRAFLESGLSCDVERWLEPGTLNVEDGRRAATRLLERAPELTAIFAATDYAAIGAIQACIARGLRVPQDVSVIGYDDIELAEYQIDYPLTTVAQPKEVMGRKAFDILLDLMRGADETSDDGNTGNGTESPGTGAGGESRPGTAADSDATPGTGSEARPGTAGDSEPTPRTAAGLTPESRLLEKPELVIRGTTAPCE